VNLTEIAAQVLSPLDAPANYLRSEIIGPDELEDDTDVDEWVALDLAVARRVKDCVLRVEADQIVEGIPLEVIVRDLEDAQQIARSKAMIRAVLASGETGIDAYRAAAAARLTLGTRFPIRVRWDGELDIKGAALALTFGADELAGPLAPRTERMKLAQVGGPPEDVHHPSPAFVESLIRAAGRMPVRR
jgi:2-iminoacetate synthase ThiH